MIRRVFQFCVKATLFAVVVGSLFLWQGGSWYFAPKYEWDTDRRNYSIEFFDDERTLLHWSSDITSFGLAAFDSKTGAELFRIEEDDLISPTVSFYKTDFVAVACPTKHQIHLFELARGNKLKTISVPQEMNGSIADLSLLRDDLIVVQTTSNEIWSFDIPSEKWKRVISFDKDTIDICLAGARVIAGSSDRKAIMAWDAEHGSLIWKRDVHPARVLTIVNWRCKDILCARLIRRGWRAPNVNNIVEGEDVILRAADGKSVAQWEFCEASEGYGVSNEGRESPGMSLDDFLTTYTRSLRKYYPWGIELSDWITTKSYSPNECRFEVTFVRPGEDKPLQSKDVFKDIRLQPGMVDEKSQSRETKAIDRDHLCLSTHGPHAANQRIADWIERVLDSRKSPFARKWLRSLPNLVHELRIFDPDDPAGTLQVLQEAASTAEVTSQLSSDGKWLMTWSSAAASGLEEPKYGRVRIYPFPIRTNWPWRLAAAIAIPSSLWIALIVIRWHVTRRRTAAR